MVTWLLGTGVIFIVLEFFVIPGFGILGLAGIVALAAGLFLLLGADAFAAGVVALLFLVFIVGLWFLFKVFPETNIWRKKLELKLSSTTDKGYVSNQSLTHWLGKEGVAHTVLRPAGSARFDDSLVDVVTDGSFIEKGAAVKVIEVEGSRVVVRKLE